MAKTNIRSFRYSDKVSKILNDFHGDSMNQKFENLVLFCFERLEIRKKCLDDIEKEITEKRSILSDLWRYCSDIDTMIRELERCKKDLLILADRPSFISYQLDKKGL